MFSLLHSSMLKRIGSGLFFSLYTVLYYIIILASNGNSSFRTTSYKGVIIPLILYGIAFAFILPTSLEFAIVQSPHKMRGLMTGLWQMTVLQCLCGHSDSYFQFPYNEVIRSFDVRPRLF